MWFRKKHHQDKLETKKSETTFHAVKISPCDNACNSAHRLTSKIFLKLEAFTLPLEDCDRIDTCRCQYEHFDDRRQNEDRRTGSVALQDVYTGDENRDTIKKGRREDD